MMSEQEKIGAGFRHKLVSAVWTSVFCFALCAINASAQTTGSSSISGTVTDPSGAVVPGVTGPANFVPEQMLEKLVQEELKHGTEEAQCRADCRPAATDRSRISQ